MSDTLSEFEGCTLLARLFRRRGYAIERNVMFREYGVEFHIDGWDRKARVGFEFLTSEDDDHDDLDLQEYNTLTDAQRRGELSLFIIDEVEPLSPADLMAEASEFLDEVEADRRRHKPARKRTTKKTGRKKKVAKKAAKRSSVKKVKNKTVTKKAVKKKAAKKKVAAKKPTKKAAKKAAKRPAKKAAKKKIRR
jgi:hypothetical protein